VRAFVLFGWVAAACNFSHGSLAKDAGDDDAPRIDAPTDGALDAAVDAAPDLGSCNTTGFTCVGGTPVAVTCNGACWLKCQQSTPVANEPAAAAACAAWGGKLAPIRDLADNNCVAVTLFPAQASWIGFEQASTATVKTDEWSWNSDGVAPTFTNWSVGQPNDLDGTEDGQEQCAFMPTNGTWQDVECAHTALYRLSCRRP
jgi:hypothetical protein